MSAVADSDTLFAVINPVAGSCEAAEVEAALRRACETAGRVLECHRTSPGEDVTTTVRGALARGCARVVAAGGDGTVAAVASALVDSTVPLAILPVGTANLLAREANIPLQLDTACHLAATGDAHRRLDAMQVGERLFFSHISLGVYSKIAERTSPAAKRYFRQIAYLWNALPELLNRHAWRFALHVDGVVSRPLASFIMIANVGGVGAGALRWGPDIAPDDGAIDVCVVHARSLSDYLALAWYVINHRHMQAPKLSYRRATREVRVASRRRVPVRGDGEIVGYSAVTVTLRRGALAVITPPPQDPAA